MDLEIYNKSSCSLYSCNWWWLTPPSFLLSGPSVESTLAERRSKIVTVGNESISGSCLTHWCFCCRWVMLYSSHLNSDSWQDTRHGKHNAAPSKSWLSLNWTTGSEMKAKKGKKKKTKNADTRPKMRRTRYSGGAAGFVSGRHRWHLAMISCHGVDPGKK